MEMNRFLFRLRFWVVNRIITDSESWIIKFALQEYLYRLENEKQSGRYSLSCSNDETIGEVRKLASSIENDNL